MPPKVPRIDCDLEPYFQYHNRIASFLEWNLDWELSEDKPSPERLARAGFFSFTKPPYISDNVVCPYCRIALDSWEPQDDPLREHQARSPDCDFVLGRETVRDMGNDQKRVTTSAPGAAGSKQNGTNGATRPKRACQKRAVGASKANDLALAGANGEEAEPPKKPRRGRPRKQPGSG